MTRPKLILLDEPAAEVNLKSCNHIWVLAKGINLANATPEEIQNNSSVLEAYFFQKIKFL